ncbi:MAG: tetratricopeptide repeat protein, partial [Flammeovirgaceae bacterium]|nr:tetratricopeptide repeat protein [Flammeovirgaceae bacterium]MDW8287039.1 tetratricopeptide repeat protein [Flammeovirgaceae bacterium]
MLFRNFIWWIALLTSLTSCQPNTSEHLIIDAPPIEDSRYWQTQIDFLSKLIRQKPNETIYYYLRAKCFMPLSRWKEALADMRFAVEQAPQQPDYWLLYAQLAKKAGEKDEIWLEALLKAEKLGCHLPALWQMLGEYYFQHNNLALAEEYLQKTTLLISDQSNIYFYLGKIYQQRGDTTKAFQYYQEALKLDKHVLPYYISLMQLHSQFGQYREVITLAEEALRHNLKDASLCYLLGYAL